jgi:pilus assembly protein Flp/PilA
VTHVLRRIEGTPMFEYSKPAAGRLLARLLGRFLRDESGASAIEYAIIASGISIVIVGTVATLGTAVKGLYINVADALK